MTKKFIICTGGSFVPVNVDDPNKTHEAAVIIEDVEQNYRVVLGLDRDEELSKPYYPFYTRVLTKEKLVYLRDELTKLIDRSCSNE